MYAPSDEELWPPVESYRSVQPPYSKQTGIQLVHYREMIKR
jgi:hypothetical protein